jgi:hypothetical protein
MIVQAGGRGQSIGRYHVSLVTVVLMTTMSTDVADFAYGVAAPASRIADQPDRPDPTSAVPDNVCVASPGLNTSGDNCDIRLSPCRLGDLKPTTITPSSPLSFRGSNQKNVLVNSPDVANAVTVPTDPSPSIANMTTNASGLVAITPGNSDTTFGPGENAWVEDKIAQVEIDGVSGNVIDSSRSGLSINAEPNRVIKTFVDRRAMVRPYDIVINSANEADWAVHVATLNAQGYGTLWIDGAVNLVGNHTFTAPISMRGLGPDARLVGAPSSHLFFGPSDFPIAAGADHSAHAGSKLTDDLAAKQNEFTAPGLGATVGDWVAVFSSTALPLAETLWHDPVAPDIHKYFPLEMVKIREVLGPDSYRVEGFIVDAMLTPATAITLDSSDTVDEFTALSHGLANDTVVFFKATNTPGGMTVNQNYFVVNSATDTFQVSATQGGSAVNFSSNGSGVTVHRDDHRPKAWKVPIAKQPNQTRSNVMIDNIVFQNLSGIGDIGAMQFRCLDGVEITNCKYERGGAERAPAHTRFRLCANVDVRSCVSDGTYAESAAAGGSEGYWMVVEAVDGLKFRDCTSFRHGHSFTTGGSTFAIGDYFGRWGTPKNVVVSDNLIVIECRIVGTTATSTGLDSHVEGWGIVFENNTVVICRGSGAPAANNQGIQTRSRATVIRNNHIVGGRNLVNTGIRTLSRDSVIEGNVIVNCGRPIYVTSAIGHDPLANALVARNTILGGVASSGGGAIRVTSPSDVRIIDNIIRGYAGGAIALNGGDNHTVLDNKIIDCLALGAIGAIEFDGTINKAYTNCTVAGNRIINFRVAAGSEAGAAINFVAGATSSGNQITNNTFINCKVAELIRIDNGSGWRIAGNDMGKGLNSTSINVGDDILAADVTIIGNTLDGYGTGMLGITGNDAASIESAFAGKNWTD